jgi:predicted nucleotidyltransferase
MTETDFWHIISLLDWSQDEDDDEAILEPAVAYLSTWDEASIYRFQDNLSEELFQLDKSVYAENLGPNVPKRMAPFLPIISSMPAHVSSPMVKNISKKCWPIPPKCRSQLEMSKERNPGTSKFCRFKYTKSQTNDRIGKCQENFKKNKSHLFATYPIKEMAIFGSFARGEAEEDSDIDILVEFSEPVGFEVVNLAEDLEELLHHKVDLVFKKAIRPNVMLFVEKDLIYV